jgi:hypothetical protein
MLLFGALSYCTGNGLDQVRSDLILPGLVGMRLPGTILSLDKWQRKRAEEGISTDRARKCDRQPSLRLWCWGCLWSSDSPPTPVLPCRGHLIPIIPLRLFYSLWLWVTLHDLLERIAPPPSELL